MGVQTRGGAEDCGEGMGKGGEAVGGLVMGQMENKLQAI